ncbi:hypothetical protein scyTo_0021830, partial [Scyliorhinus torazame]|nr:hypothetical protein [Scyliorhinus torazame]
MGARRRLPVSDGAGRKRLKFGEKSRAVLNELEPLCQRLLLAPCRIRIEGEMEPINSWSPRRVSVWLQGLDNSVQKYQFDQWQVNGEQLLRLSQQDLEELGVKQIGHQELILEAVELLCTLTYDLETENLKILMEKLKAVSGTLQSFIVSRRKVSPGPQRPSGDLLTSVIDLLQTTKAIFSWLNRYPFICLINYSAMKREIIRLCMELAETIHK